MTDIMKYILNHEDYREDPAGNLLEQGEWNTEVAKIIAEKEQVTLSEAHWAVIYFLRSNFKEQGLAPNARVLTQSLAKHFAAVGGKRYLYQLFPKGPVTQACRIAGLPVPAQNADLSFGTVR